MMWKSAEVQRRGNSGPGSTDFAQLWLQLDLNTKATFEQQAEARRKEYDEEMAIYRSASTALPRTAFEFFIGKVEPGFDFEDGSRVPFVEAYKALSVAEKKRFSLLARLDNARYVRECKNKT